MQSKNDINFRIDIRCGVLYIAKLQILNMTHLKFQINNFRSIESSDQIINIDRNQDIMHDTIKARSKTPAEIYNNFHNKDELVIVTMSDPYNRKAKLEYRILRVKSDLCVNDISYLLNSI